jgi:2-polyprenyl-3-methyl-5-hydroxy-6-metoxy-1,4-benzoquinol methylase
VSDPERFEQSYWTKDSQYRKFEDYAAALAALRDWYQGFFRLVEAELPAPGRSLDAGCGHGAIVYELAARGFAAHGFDLSSFVVEEAQRANPAMAERFAVGGLPDVPFEGSFDLVTCLEVLEHLDDPAVALRSLAGRLRAGGRLIATTPNLCPRIPWRDARSADPTHVNVQEPAWWRETLVEAGLEVRDVSTFVAVPALWRVHPALARWIPVGPSAGPGTLLIAQAPR